MRNGLVSDLLRGDEGMDRLDGGSGNDRLYGGAMADMFDGQDFEATGLAQRAFDHVAFRAEDLAIRDTRSGALISWDVNDDGRNEGSILLKDVDVADMRQSDFMFGSEQQFAPGICDFGSHYILG